MEKRESPPNSEENLRLILQQNCEHARHIEQLRMRFAYIYVLTTGGIFSLTTSGIIPAFNILPIFVIVLSLLGVVETYNHTNAYRNHVKKVRSTAKALGVTDFLALGVLFQKSGHWEILMHPWEYYLLYLINTGLATYLLVV